MRLGQIGYHVRDLTIPKRFYSAFFGKDPDYTEHDVIAWKVEDRWINFYAYDPVNEIKGADMMLEVDDVDAWYRKGIELGGQEDWSPQDTWIFKECRFAKFVDPNGIHISLIKYEM
ncbi:MAG: hypothetical protein A3F16_03325 [Deltaproteobacteria bacterium RIFCSPHIGHO2_12_FULL_43_9]|nr:MAG: hypothetical protein A3F16_03325 [Deltaproteobacteria bacterium RIFCSPHIGHO2_12_FULL_43_9]